MAQYEAARPTTFASPEAAAERVSTFLRSVYAWMCVGLPSPQERRRGGVARRRSSPPSREPIPVLGHCDRPARDRVRAVGPRPHARLVHGLASVHRLFGADRPHAVVRAARLYR